MLADNYPQDSDYHQDRFVSVTISVKCVRVWIRLLIVWTLEGDVIFYICPCFLLIRCKVWDGGTRKIEKLNFVLVCTLHATWHALSHWSERKGLWDECLWSYHPDQKTRCWLTVLGMRRLSSVFVKLWAVFSFQWLLWLDHARGLSPHLTSKHLNTIFLSNARFIPFES